MKLLLIDPKPDGLKGLVGDVELRRRQFEGGLVWDYSNDEMPYVYAHNIEFPIKPYAWDLLLELFDQI